MQLYVLCFLLLVVSCTTAILWQGIDVKQPVTLDQIHCLRDRGDEIVYIRGYIGLADGMVDYNACNTFQLAEGNIFPSIYMEPSTTGSKSGAQQFNEMYSSLKGCGVPSFSEFNLWVKSPSSWNKDVSKNVKFIRDVIAAAHKLVTRVGIHTSENEWKAITNNADHTDLISNNATYLPLWWDNAPDNGQINQNMNNFNSFGAWTMENIASIQYAKNQVVCGINCNQDFF